MPFISKSHDDFVIEVSKNRPDVVVLSTYKTSKHEVKLKCECGWEYSQLAGKLLAGQKGCPICGNASNYNQNTETFKERAKRTHNNYYDYSKAIYTKASEKLLIVCPVHGDFMQSPINHIKMGQGCPKCGVERRKHYIGWTYTEWEKAGLASKNFTGFKLYKVRCFDPDTKEEFIKIGKTFVDLHSRFLTIPYEYEVLEVKEGSARFISTLEFQIQEALKDKKYKPVKMFCGMAECFIPDGK